MSDFERRDLAVQGVGSLTWRGDELIDWVRGGRVYRLDGTVRESFVSHTYRFDAAVVSPSGRFAVLYERLGTKGLVLDQDANLVREIDRSYYFADTYEYPVALFSLPDGTECLAHCPEEYCRLDIEETASGRRLSPRGAFHENSCFLSRLTVDPSGRFLLSAGWVWQPIDVLNVFAIHAGAGGLDLRLDRCPALEGMVEDEVSCAAFAGPGRLLLASHSFAREPLPPDPNDPNRDREGQTRPAWHRLEEHDVERQQRLSSAPLALPEGVLMPVGRRHVVGFHTHPKLIERATGRVVLSWPDLASGGQE